MAAGPSHYEVLGVPPTASSRELRTAYRARARALHPDRAGEAGQAAMARLNEAWAVLGDPERRKAYDASLVAPPAAAATAMATAASWTPPRASGCGWMVAVGVALSLLAGVVAVLVLSAGSGGDRSETVDGVLHVGSCVATSPTDGSLREVSCDGPHEASVVALIARDQTCPPGSRLAASASVAVRLCLA